MLLTSLIISSSLANRSLTDLSLVKSQAVESERMDRLSRQKLTGELVRFQDGYGRQFTVIRGTVASEMGGDRFADVGHAVCRYDANGLLDRVKVFNYLNAEVRKQFTRTGFNFEGQLKEDTFSYEVRVGPKNEKVGPAVKLSGYSATPPFFSLLEAVVLFDYQPKADPLYLLNPNLSGGQPAVLRYGFTRAVPEGSLAELGNAQPLLLAVQPGSTPNNFKSGGAIDQSGTVYFKSMYLFAGVGEWRKSDRSNAFATDGTPVRRVGDVSEEAIAEITKLIPDKWREKPKD
jgi:hypothetical protein